MNLLDPDCGLDPEERREILLHTDAGRAVIAAEDAAFFASANFAEGLPPGWSVGSYVKGPKKGSPCLIKGVRGAPGVQVKPIPEGYEPDQQGGLRKKGSIANESSPSSRVESPVAPAGKEASTGVVPDGFRLRGKLTPSGLRLAQDDTGDLHTVTNPSPDAVRKLEKGIRHMLEDGPLYKEARDGLLSLPLMVQLIRQAQPEATLPDIYDAVAQLSKAGGSAFEGHELNETQYLKNQEEDTIWDRGRAKHYYLIDRDANPNVLIAKATMGSQEKQTVAPSPSSQEVQPAGATSGVRQLSDAEVAERDRKSAEQFKQEVHRLPTNRLNEIYLAVRQREYEHRQNAKQATDPVEQRSHQIQADEAGRRAGSIGQAIDQRSSTPPSPTQSHYEEAKKAVSSMKDHELVAASRGAQEAIDRFSEKVRGHLHQRTDTGEDHEAAAKARAIQMAVLKERADREMDANPALRAPTPRAARAAAAVRDLSSRAFLLSEEAVHARLAALKLDSLSKNELLHVSDRQGGGVNLRSTTKKDDMVREIHQMVLNHRRA